MHMRSRRLTAIVCITDMYIVRLCDLVMKKSDSAQRDRTEYFVRGPTPDR